MSKVRNFLVGAVLDNPDLGYHGRYEEVTQEKPAELV